MLQEALGISHVAEPTSSATQGIVFLIDKQLLYQITCFGISERDVTVSILLWILRNISSKLIKKSFCKYGFIYLQVLNSLVQSYLDIKFVTISLFE